MIIVFTMVSLSIKYLGKEAYGLWVLLSGILLWTTLFDFGLTNGLRNKLTESLASRDKKEYSQKIISTTYALMFGIAIGSYLLIGLIIYLVDWVSLLHINNFSNDEVQVLLLIIFFAFSINLFLKPIEAILNALQWPSIISFLLLIGSFLSLISLLILMNLDIENRLLFYTIMVVLSPVITLIIGTGLLFSSRLKKFKPSFKNIDFTVSKDISSLGTSFLIIQLAALIIAQTDTIIIATLFGTESVTDYNIVLRYFSLFIVLFMIILSPFWSAFTDAYVKKEFTWIHGSIRKLLVSFLLISMVVITSIFYANDVYKLWINENIEIPFSLSVSMGIYVIMYGFSNIFMSFVNGVGYIKLQMYTGTLMAILNVPLSYLFAIVLDYGITGVIISTILCTAIPGFFSFIQYRKIMSGQGKGIWIK